MFANIGPAEAIIILIAILSALFGSKKTTEIVRDVGGASKELKKARKEYQEAVEELKRPITEALEAPMTETAPPVDAAKAEVAQLAQLAQAAKEKSKSEGGEKIAS